MYITNLSHFLNEHGDIPADMRPQAKNFYLPDRQVRQGYGQDQAHQEGICTQ